MLLNNTDWILVFAYFAVSLGIGIWVARSTKNTSDYFTGGGKMPWWLLGVSMVATTFSTDTPNLVTDIVRQNGVSGNWVWWAFLLTGLLTVFVYARLWKKSGVLTDVEFYEIRYSGKMATFLRGFRAIYLGFFFNVVIMASVSLAAIKIGGILLGLSPVETILIASAVTVVYSAIGGLKGVLFTDFIQFFLSIGGAITAAIISLNHPKVGGLSNLLSHESVVDKLSFFPDPGNVEQFITILLIPLFVQWWSVWYPGSEPGGGGYVAQRMFAAKNESNAIKAVFLFNIAHYALRPWPWIIVALCSIIVFPNLQSFQEAFPGSEAALGHDLGYPAMLTFLPHGILGLVVTSLIAAYMSTISTHLNWGSSYIVHDFYKRFVKPESTEKELLWVGRLSTVVLMAVAIVISLLLENALDSFQILLQIGAGTGLIFILRWFWWRVNALSEITAMAVSFVVAVAFKVMEYYGLDWFNGWQQLVVGVGITTISWVLVAYLSEPTERSVLASFLEKVKPGGPGWRHIIDISPEPIKGIELEDKTWKVPYGILCMISGTVGIYSLLLGTGHFIYGNLIPAILVSGLAVVAFYFVSRFWKKIVE